MIQGCLIRIVDDDEDMRESLSFLLESEGWQCAAYASAREFLIEDAGSVPGCLILDIRMPEMTGLELQQEMNRRKIFLPIVFLTGHGSIDMAVSAMKFGAVEFLQKPVDHARLLGIVRDCVRRCRNGFAVLDFDIIEAKRRWETLTEKEQQVLTLIAAGLLNKEAAERLGNSVRTIENHRAAAMKRLQIKT
ncbi:response regulator, partial [uncultured Parasutterella sp.]